MECFVKFSMSFGNDKVWPKKKCLKSGFHKAKRTFSISKDALAPLLPFYTKKWERRTLSIRALYDDDGHSGRSRNTHTQAKRK